MTYSIAINPEYAGKIPEGISNDVWRKFNGDFINLSLDVEQLAYFIQEGRAYTTWHRGYRKQSNFMQGQHIGIDFDTEDEDSTFDCLRLDPFITKYATLLHTTASHTTDKPRARVVFLLDRPIPYPDKYTLLAKSLLHFFGTADRKCKDPCRLFFGAIDCDIEVLGNTLTLEAAAHEMVQPYLRYEERLKAEREKAYAERKAKASNATVDDKQKYFYIQAILKHEIDRLAFMPKGGRNNELLKTAKTLAGIFKADWCPAHALDERTVIDELVSASQRNGEYAEDGEEAIIKTIRNGINYATPRREPLWGERKAG